MSLQLIRLKKIHIFKQNLRHNIQNIHHRLTHVLHTNVSHFNRSGESYIYILFCVGFVYKFLLKNMPPTMIISFRFFPSVYTFIWFHLKKCTFSRFHCSYNIYSTITPVALYRTLDKKIKTLFPWILREKIIEEINFKHQKRKNGNRRFKWIAR